MPTLFIIFISGWARLSNVEFSYTGQKGFSDKYDPRFSLAFLNLGPIVPARPCFVMNCTFHNTFATAIGVFGVTKFEISNNVIYKTIGSGKYLEHNLIIIIAY